MLCRDWNVVITYQKDTINYSRENNPKLRPTTFCWSLIPLTELDSEGPWLCWWSGTFVFPSDNICRRNSSMQICGQVGLVIKSTMTVKTSHGSPIIIIDQWSFCGDSLVSNDSGTESDITSRIPKPKSAFCLLRPAWKSQQFTLRTKIKLNNHVNTVLTPLLFRVLASQQEHGSTIVVNYSGLRRICKIMFPGRIRFWTKIYFFKRADPGFL